MMCPKSAIPAARRGAPIIKSRRKTKPCGEACCLTRQEVIAVQGPPTSASKNKLAYGNSELDFNGDKLTGWKIDPASPIRVKLWPDAAVDPDLKFFWLGSSKNEVLVAQGTPAYWSENTIGYGGSEVYFKAGKVAGWKNDPATVPLRAARR
jgi:hypothetical protein